MIQRVQAVGRLRVFRTLNRRFTELLVDTHNMVVDDGLSAISRLIGGGYGAPTVGAGMTTYPLTDLSGAAVGSMLLGIRDGLMPPAAGDGDAGVIPDVSIPNSSGFKGSFSTSGSTLAVSYPTAVSVRFTATVGAGLWSDPQPPITEEMLVTEMGTVFARVVLPLPVSTTLGNGLSFVHDIILSRA